LWTLRKITYLSAALVVVAAILLATTGLFDLPLSWIVTSDVSPTLRALVISYFGTRHEVRIAAMVSELRNAAPEARGLALRKLEQYRTEQIDRLTNSVPDRDAGDRLVKLATLHPPSMPIIISALTASREDVLRKKGDSSSYIVLLNTTLHEINEAAKQINDPAAVPSLLAAIDRLPSKDIGPFADKLAKLAPDAPRQLIKEFAGLSLGARRNRLAALEVVLEQPSTVDPVLLSDLARLFVDEQELRNAGAQALIKALRKSWDGTATQILIDALGIVAGRPAASETATVKAEIRAAIVRSGVGAAPAAMKALAFPGIGADICYVLRDLVIANPAIGTNLVQPLLPYLRDSDWATARAAMRALAATHDSRAMAALDSALGDNTDSTVLSAALALFESGTDGQTIVLSAFRQGNDRTRGIIAQVFAGVFAPAGELFNPAGEAAARSAIDAAKSTLDAARKQGDLRSSMLHSVISCGRPKTGTLR
jgi:hypothetical protein